MAIVSVNPFKRFVRRLLRSRGYVIRDVGTGASGVDMLHDADVLLGHPVDPIVFDIGANIGQTAVAAHDLWPGARIVSFEPSPSCLPELRERARSLRGVVVEPIAMGAHSGTVAFHVTRDHSVNDSLLAPTWNAGGDTVQVPVETVAAYCEARRIERIDLLKIDAQGYDLEVLRGASPLLRERRVALFACEVMFEPMYVGQTSLREVLAFAAEVGYELAGMYELSYVNNRLLYADLLFRAPAPDSARPRAADLPAP